jgi:serine acetyltransferase
MQNPAPVPRLPRPATDAERLTWADTRRLIRADFARLCAWYGGGTFSKRVFWFFQPNFQALFLYRLYRHLYVNGWRNSARLLFLYSLYLTGVEISPTTSIVPGCLIAHAFGVILFGKIGARFSIFGQSGMGGGFSEQDIGGGPGYPVVGDDVIFGIKSVALGPVRIGNRVRLSPGAFVTCDVPDDAMVLAAPSKVIRVRMGSAPGDTPQ